MNNNFNYGNSRKYNINKIYLKTPVFSLKLIK